MGRLREDELPVMREYDLAVIGAGPAGSSAAREAAKRGVSVALIEKKAMPRYKPCGGAVSAASIGEFGFDLPADLIDSACIGTRVRCGRFSSTARLKENVAVLVSRDKFDHFLVRKAEEAGAEFIQAKAHGIRRDPPGLAIDVTGGSISCRAAVVAQGAVGRLIAAVRPPDGPGESGVCVEHRFPVQNPDPFECLKDLIEIHLGTIPHGYGWVFHHGSYYSVGVGGVKARFPKPSEAFRTFCLSIGLVPPDRPPRGHLIPRGGIRREVVADNIVLAGDSAGFVDAFSGEGIAFALESGVLAGRTMADALAEEDLSRARLGEYARACDRAFGDRLRGSLLLSRILYAAPGIFLRLFAADSAVQEKYVRVPQRRKSYIEYVRWLVCAMPWLMAKDLLRPGQPQ